MEPRRVIITTEDSPNMQRSRQEQERLNNSSRSPNRMRMLARVSNNSVRRSPPTPLRMSHDRSQIDQYSSGSSINSGHILNQVPINSFDAEFRGPFMPGYSTPKANVSLPSHHESFGSQIDYNLSWMPSDVQISDPVDISSIFREQSRGLRLPDKYLQRELNIMSTDSNLFEKKSSSLNSSFLLNQPPIMKTDSEDLNARSPRKESLMEWFDRTVEKELQKRRDDIFLGENIVNLESPSLLSVIKTQESIVADAHTSNVDIIADLRNEVQTDMLEAVDKLAKAEAVCVFEGAVKAAEKAAAAAPPEYAEEAAAAGAQGFQAEITNTIKQEIPGIKPIEVMGYVGITRPKKPKKSNFSGI